MKTLYALLGTPGVGKTTFIKNISQEIFGDDRLTRYVVGPDLIRSMVQPPVTKADGTTGISQANEKYVWGIVNDILDRKTARGELIIVDATHSRNKAISAYKKYSDDGYRVVLIDFSDYATLEEIFERNKSREDFKFVPEHVIEAMYERIKSLDIPGWVEVIKPNDFKDHLTNVKHDWSEFKDITFIGDIHGCADEFKEILTLAGIDPSGLNGPNKDRAIVFVGDYFDRGPKVIETFRILQNLSRNHYTLMLIGNHETALKHYRDFVRAFHEIILDWITAIDVPSSSTKKAKRSWFYRFFKSPKISKKSVPLDMETCAWKLIKNYRTSSYKHMDNFIRRLKEYPIAWKAFENLVWEYNFRNCPAVKRSAWTTFKKFLLEGIKYTEVADFYKRLAQMAYINYRGKDIAVTHGGITECPSKLISTIDMISGVGGYEETLKCDQTFNRNCPDTVGIHGHRNLEGIYIQSTPGTYNINGDVDIGLRALQIDPSLEFKTIEVPPLPATLEYNRKRQIRLAQKFRAKKLSAEEEGSDLIRLFQDHDHVDVKRLPGDVAAVNFTKRAFEKGVWDSITIKARGLFIAIDTKDNPVDQVIARGYQKFFNLNEPHGIKRQELRNLIYPVRAFEKANGYLGILSVDNRDPSDPKWFIASKTTNRGDYAEHFKKMIEPSLTEALKQRMIQDNVTLLFEVIDPEFDPHIEEYHAPELVLLDAVKNQLQFERVPYELIHQYIILMEPQPINVREKVLMFNCLNYSELIQVITGAQNIDLFEQNSIEGYVFEEDHEDPQMFKVKSNWYSFWKYIRSLRDKVVRKIEKSKDSKLSKSELIEFKSKLHIAEQIRAFNALVELAEADPVSVKAMSIPQLRKAILTKLDSNKTSMNQ